MGREKDIKPRVLRWPAGTDLTGRTFAAQVRVAADVATDPPAAEWTVDPGVEANELVVTLDFTDLEAGVEYVWELEETTTIPDGDALVAGAVEVEPNVRHP